MLALYVTALVLLAVVAAIGAVLFAPGWSEVRLSTAGEDVWVGLDDLLVPSAQVVVEEIAVLSTPEEIAPHAAQAVPSSVVAEERPAVEVLPLADATAEDFAALVTRVIVDSGLPVYRFADLVGVSRSTISAWQAGRRPSTENEAKVRQVADVVATLSGDRAERRSAWDAPTVGGSLFESVQAGRVAA